MSDLSAELQIYGKLHEALRLEIGNAWRELLQAKHLYQSVKVEPKSAKNLVEVLHTRLNKTAGFGEVVELGGEHVPYPALKTHLSRYLDETFAGSWKVMPELFARPPSKFSTSFDELIVTAPSIEVYCRGCKATKLHSSGSLKRDIDCPPYPMGPGEQVFTCAYECQVCKGPPVVFQVTRRKEKLTLTGCSEYPEVSVPKEIPHEICEYISQALIAHGTGRTLAALFFLRTAIEQHMRQITGIKGRSTGDDIAGAYHEKLAEKFPPHEWVLGITYGNLSEKLHSAEADAAVFGKCWSDVQRFFRVLELYPLKVVASPSVASPASPTPV